MRTTYARRMLVGVLVTAIVLVGATVVLAQGGPGGPGAGRGGGPGQGPGGMIGNPGAWQGPGGMMGGAWAGPGWGSGGMMSGWCPAGAGAGGAWWQPRSQTGNAMTFDEAIAAAQEFVGRLDNQDLALTEALEFERHVYFVVKERSTGLGAFAFLVGKQSGAVRPEPGPSMVWNTKYGRHGGDDWFAEDGYWSPGPPSVEPGVTGERARELAQAWLDRFQPGSATDEAIAFYGYYTVHTLQNGQMTGMLSVNAYTGQVWYHSWHGGLIAAKDLGG